MFLLNYDDSSVYIFKICTIIILIYTYAFTIRQIIGQYCNMYIHVNIEKSNIEKQVANSISKIIFIIIKKY